MPHSAHVHVYCVCVCAGGNQRVILSTLLRQGLSLEQLPASPWDMPVSAAQYMRLEVLLPRLASCVGTGDPNSGSHAGISHT